LIFDSEQLIQARTLAPDVLDVQRAVDLPAVPPGADDTADAKHPKVPGDARLAHAKMRGQVVDAFLSHLSETLQDAKSRRVGEGQKVIWKLVSGALDKHKACFIRV
jgi:hypothetical protein